MADEQRHYERAASGALLGLALQALLGLALLGLGLWTAHPAVLAGAWQAAGGLPAWLCLLLILQQHRLERLEALGAEALARQAGAEGRLFEESADELRRAKRRVAALYRFALPLTGVLTAAYLLAAGAWLLKQALPGAHAAQVREPLAALAFAAGLTFVGFVVSRYLAGVAKLPGAQILRAGAGYLMGTVLVCCALGAGHAAAHFESLKLLGALSLAVPAFMLATGLETALNLVLELYRPRKPGEPPRPAFDSRLLGLLTAPESLTRTIQEAINYQFGFEITRSWFWQLLARATAPLAALGAVSLLVLSCVIIVPPHQRALVLRFGGLRSATALAPGLHFKLPWPVETARFFDVTRVRELRVGAQRLDGAAGPHEHHHGHGHGQTPILWTNVHAAHKEDLWIVGAQEAGPPQDQAAPASRSLALLNAYIPIQYRIKDDGVLASAERTPDPDAWLRQLAQAEITRFMFAGDLDRLMGPERAAAGAELRRRLQRAADAAKLGLEIVFVGMAGLHPPLEGEVARTFHDPISAQQEKAIALEEAAQFRTRLLTEAAGSVEQAEELLAEIRASQDPRLAEAERRKREQDLGRRLYAAGGGVAKLIAEARAARWTAENAERARAERFVTELPGYSLAPRLYCMRRYLEVLAQALAEPRKYLLIGDRQRLTVRLDLKDADIGLPRVDLFPKEH
jgi:regulator of protease activity HflC (stomatin/prohibitin superfamily)